MKELSRQRFLDSIETKKKVIEDEALVSTIASTADAMAEVIANGGKILLCGNGGSASDALHIAGEIVGRFQKERKSWPAVVLNADVATLTAIANDYGYDNAFARQVEGFMTEKDLLIGITTSGNSENIYRAILKAKEIGGKTAVLTGRTGGKTAPIVDFPLVVPCDVTARIQESHITIGHIMCEIVEEKLATV